MRRRNLPFCKRSLSPFMVDTTITISKCITSCWLSEKPDIMHYNNVWKFSDACSRRNAVRLYNLLIYISAAHQPFSSIRISISSNSEIEAVALKRTTEDYHALYTVKMLPVHSGEIG